MSGNSNVLRRLEWATLTDLERTALLDRGAEPIADDELKASVAEIVADVRFDGDAAVSRALAKYDRCEIAPDRLRVGEDEIEAAAAEVPGQLIEAIRVGIANIRAFNERLVAGRSWRMQLSDGLEVGEQATPISSAGLFVPSGKGSFPSVLMQVGTPACVAGVKEIAVVVPPLPGGDGRVDPAVLCVAAELGLRNVFRANGPAGIAALSCGTATIPKVRKIVGPGSPPVAAAQVICQTWGTHSQVLMGPSESLVIADDSADPRLLAADLLIEAEHGADSATLLVTWSEGLVAAVEDELAEQLEALPEARRGYAESSLGVNGGAVIVAGLEAAVEVANLYAPEHMQIAVEDQAAALALVEHAGEVLVGQGTPFSLANYVAGIPAALPTGRFARVTGGVTAETFMKKISIAEAGPEAMASLGPAIVALADHEGFPAHAAAIRMRLEGGDS